MCRVGEALSVILPVYEVLLYDDGCQNSEETGIEGEELEDLLMKVKDRTYGQYSVIGRQWSKCYQSILAVAETKAVSLLGT